MRIEHSITAAALIALPLGAYGQPRFPLEILQNEEPEIAAPFVEKLTYVISAENAVHHKKWQSVLSSTSSYGERISVTTPTEVTIGSSERTPSELIADLKRFSGLTWGQISEVFDVKERTLHYWKAGKTISAEHHQQLGAAVAMINFVDRGTAEENRRLLLSEARDGKTFADLMKSSDFQSIMELAGEGVGRISFGTSITKEARSKNAFPEYSPSTELSNEVDVEISERPQTRRKKIRRAKV